MKLENISTSVRMIVAGLLLSSTASCTDALVFAENSGFNLGISVNEEPSTPLQVNAGLERTVLAFAPPAGETTTSGGKKSPKGEAVSLFSGFRLEDNHANVTQSAFAGKLTIRTQFASGIAAQSVAGDIKTVKAITSVGVSYKPDANSIYLRTYMNKSTVNMNKLLAWMKLNKVPGKFPEPFLVGAKYAQLRTKAVKELD